MNESKTSNFKKMCSYLPDLLSESLCKIGDIDSLCEIRIKTDSPIFLIFTDGRKFITQSGRLTSFLSENLLKATKSDVGMIFARMCEHSVHSHVESINNGYITVGANRVGVYGTAVVQDGRVVSVRDISGLNIRISGDFPGVADVIIDRLYKSGAVNTLICGAPSTGKTTMLRDLCRSLSDKMLYKTTVVDEREEFYENVGENTDVLSRYPKSIGIQVAVRTLSPEIIICDEIGTSDEVEAVAQGLNSGVKFVMSIHCNSYNELEFKPQYKLLKKYGGVDYCVFLKGKCEIDTITQQGDEKDENYCSGGVGNVLCAYGSVHSLQA